MHSQVITKPSELPDQWGTMNLRTVVDPTTLGHGDKINNRDPLILGIAPTDLIVEKWYWGSPLTGIAAANNATVPVLVYTTNLVDGILSSDDADFTFLSDGTVTEDTDGINLATGGDAGDEYNDLTLLPKQGSRLVPAGAAIMVKLMDIDDDGTNTIRADIALQWNWVLGVISTEIRYITRAF